MAEQQHYASRGPHFSGGGRRARPFHSTAARTVAAASELARRGALVLMVAIIMLLGSGARQMAAPFTGGRQPEITLAPSVLPNYALRTTMRMLAALVASLVFTLTYATFAAKSRRAEMMLIPPLDVLQSVPVLGYLSFTVVFFVALLPGRVLGTELARHLCDLHQPGVEHGLQFLSVAPHDPDRPRRGQPRFPLVGLAALLASRGAVRDAGPYLEHDDVDVRRLVFRGGLGSHCRRRPARRSARHRLLCRARDCGSAILRRSVGPSSP